MGRKVGVSLRQCNKHIAGTVTSSKELLFELSTKLLTKGQRPCLYRPFVPVGPMESPWSLGVLSHKQGTPRLHHVTWSVISTCGSLVSPALPSLRPHAVMCS